MKKFTIYKIDTAPEASKPLLEENKREFGIEGNMPGIMAAAPGLLEGYKVLHKLFANSSFNNEELTVIWLTINVEHECTYCVPAHTAIAHMMKVDPALIEALRNSSPMTSPKLQVLQDTTLSIVRNRGNISETEIDKFYAAGYKQRQLLEIILGLSQKIISNYVNHIANTEIDAPFQKYIWNK